MLRRLGAEPVEVRKPEQLDGLDGLVIPGGESTAIMRLVRLYGLDEAMRAFDGSGARHLRGDDRARPGPPRRARPRGRPQRLRAPGGELRGRPRARRRRAAAARRLHPRAARRATRARGRGARRARRRAGAPARGPGARRLVPSGADRRHARARAVPRARPGGGAMSGHSKWSSIKHKKGAADAKRGKLFSKLSRAIIVAAREGGPDPAANLALAERDREGALLLHAEGQHRARDRARLRRGRRRRQPSRRSSTRATARTASP